MRKDLSYNKEFGTLRVLGWGSEDSECPDISRESSRRGVKAGLHMSVMIESESTSRTHREARFNSIQTLPYFFLIFYFILFIFLFLAALGLHCCMWAFSSCGERGLLFVVVCGLQ